MEKKLPRNQYQHFLTLVVLGTCGSLQANPEGLHLVSGEASSSNPASHILEITSGNKAIIEWDSFSIANHEITKFIQQDSSSSVLNRVTGDMSKILGTLESNGKVFLINPNGIIIGEGARIDTGSFIASTFDILNADFLEGKDLLFSGDSEHTIINLGTIHAAGGDVILLAHRIKNEGVITAPEGQVSLNSGNDLLLQTGSSKVFIRPKLSKNPSKEIGIENTGTIQAVEAHLNTDGNLFALAINQSGVIEATGIENRNGRIHLVSENSRVVVTGDMKAKNGDNGGTIHVLGKEVLLLDQATLDVSGKVNGGEVLLGGDYQGQNPDIYNADVTHVDEGVVIKASSQSLGNGGKVVLWGNSYTGYLGNISAKGGPLGGDGGFTEISSPEHLAFNSFVDLSAPYGKSGTLLLDPSDITITANPSTSGFRFSATGSYPSYPDTTPVNINVDALNTQLALNSVILDASLTHDNGAQGSITVDLPAGKKITYSGNNYLTLDAANTAPLTLTTADPTGIIIDITPGSNIIPLNLISSGGTITLNGIVRCAGGSLNLHADLLNITNSSLTQTSGFDYSTSTGIVYIFASNTNIACQGTGYIKGNVGVFISEVSNPSSTISVVAGGGPATISTVSGIIDIGCNTMSLSNQQGSTSIASIQTGPTGSILFDPVNTVIISSSGSAQAFISSQNGNISGELNNLTIEPTGSQNNYISTTGTGNIFLISNQEDGTYLLTGTGSGSPMINTGAGTITLDFQGVDSGLSLLGLSSPAKVLRTGPGAGAITISGENAEAFLLVNGVRDTPTPFSASIENQLGDIVVNFSGPNSEILVGNNSVSAPSLIQTTTNPGNITITQNNGILTLQGGNGPSSNVGITTTFSGQIEILGGGSTVSLLGGTGSLSEAFIQSTTAPTTINALSLSLMGGIGASSDAFISPITSGNVSITAPTVLLHGGSSSTSGQAFITIADTISSIDIIASSSLSLLGGVSPGQNTAFISSTNAGNGNPLSLSLGGLLIQGGSGNLTDSAITSTGGPITITGIGSNDLSLLGGNGNGSSAKILSLSGAITITSPNQNLILTGNSGASSFASIEIFLTSPLTINVNNLTLTGGSGPTSYATLQTIGSGALNITAAGNISLTGGSGNIDSKASAIANSGALTITAGGDINLKGGSNVGQALLFSTTNNVHFTSARNVTLMGGMGPSAFAQIGAPSTSNSNILFDRINRDLFVVGGSNQGYAIIGHGSPLDAGNPLLQGNITFTSIGGEVFLSSSYINPSFGQIGHVNSTASSSTLSGNISLTATGDVTVMAVGNPGYALIGMGGQTHNNSGTDSFTSDITINARNVITASTGESKFTVGGFSVIGFLSPGTSPVAIHSTNFTINAQQDIVRTSENFTSGPIVGIGSYVFSNSNSSSATITNFNLSAGQNFRFTLDNSPSQYSQGIDFIGTYFTQNSLATGSSSITITAGRNFFFDEYMLGLANHGFLQNTNPKNITSHLPIEIQAGNGFYTSQGLGDTMSVISSGTLSINDPSNPQGDVIISNLMQSYSGMEIIAGMNLILDAFATLTNTTSGNISLVADNLNPTSPGFNPAFGFTLIAPATVNNTGAGKIFIYSSIEDSTHIGNGETPSLNGNVFVHGPELVNSSTEEWNVYFPSTGTATSSSYKVFYKNIIPTPHSPGPTPSELALLKTLAFDRYEGDFLISQMLYPQPEILDDYLFWAEAFSTSYDMKKYEKVPKKMGYRSSYDVLQKQKFILDRNKYFNFYEILLQRDVQIKR